MSKSEKTSETSLSKPAETAVGTAMDVGAWDSGPKFRSAKDIVVSRILAMQGMSKLVTAGKAMFGEFRDSVTGEKLGNVDNPVDFIPIRWDLVWSNFKKEKGDWVWDGFEPVTAENDNRPFEQGDRRSDRTLMFYGLRPDDLQGLPSIVSFTRTSLKGGRKLQALMEDRLKGAGLPPCAKVVKISANRAEKDGKTYIVTDTEVGRDSKPEEIEVAFSWFKKLKTMDNIKVDNSEFEAEVGKSAPVDINEDVDF